jgi:hypothetical protein
LSTINPTQTTRGLSLGLCGEKPANNRLSYDRMHPPRITDSVQAARPACLRQVMGTALCMSDFVTGFDACCGWPDACCEHVRLSYIATHFRFVSATGDCLHSIRVLEQC